MHTTVPPEQQRCNSIHCFSAERGERDKGKEERGGGKKHEINYSSSNFNWCFH
jgi:hypothetical protein